MCIFYVQLLWEYLAICQRAHNHSLTSPESREETVKFIASESKSRKSFLTCPPPNGKCGKCSVHMCLCVRGCVLCVVVLPALAYFIFQLPAYAHDFNPAASGWRSRLELPLLLSCVCLPLVYHCHIFFGWMCAKETTPLSIIFIYSPCTLDCSPWLPPSFACIL